MSSGSALLHAVGLDGEPDRAVLPDVLKFPVLVLPVLVLPVPVVPPELDEPPADDVPPDDPDDDVVCASANVPERSSAPMAKSAGASRIACPPCRPVKARAEALVSAVTTHVGERCRLGTAL